MKRLIIALMTSILFASCTPRPEPVNYGEDQCHFCKMTIVDDQHAAELVTTKGKVFKFDAIECMIQYAERQADEQYAIKLVNDYAAPGEWVDADRAIYLVSENVPSPMGANLSAFSERETADRIRKDKGGTLYNWQEINEQIIEQ